MMWQEARKQEKKIRGMLVDYKRRAERRKDYYEKIKAEPTQFIQLHGRPCKIHLDPAVAIAGDSPANMMSWQGNHDILIDRFDVRAHLDYISENKSSNDDEEEFSQEERLINYERYRILAQNDFLGVTEDKFLHQLAIEEQFGPVEKTEPPPIEGKKKVVGAAIGYNYGEGTIAGGEPARAEKQSSDESEDEEEDEDSDIDFDLCVDVNKISSAQAHEMNTSALAYGMVSNDFFSYLTKDVEEAENLKIAREREEEKAMFSGRKSRRERRAFREKKLIGRKLSPPSYAASKEAPIADLIRTVTKSRSKSRSRSASPPNAGMIQYITSFGGDEVPLEPPPPQTIKTSVHPSKEEDKVFKRTVRYRSSRSPESGLLRNRSASPKSSYKYRSTSRSRETSPADSRRSRSRSPRRPSKSPERRTVRYRSRTPSPASIRTNERPRSSREHERTSSTSYRRRQSSSKSRSKSPFQRIVKKTSPQPVRSVEVPAPPVITRYYGRRKNESSSSDLELSDSESKSETSDRFPSSNKNAQPVGNSGGRSKPATPATAASKLSLQERLKKKRQALINRQYKADKKAERLRQEKAEQERQDREDEMREISIKMRRRERQKRHQYYELDESNAAELSDTDDDRLSGATSDSASDNNGSDAELSSRSRSRKIKDPDKLRTSRERSRERDSRRDSDSRRDDDNRRDGDRSEDRDRRRRFRDDERSRGRDRSRDKYRERSRDRDRYRRERDRSKERGRGWSRERERYSGRRSRSRDRENEDGSGYFAVKKPIRPLVDY